MGLQHKFIATVLFIMLFASIAYGYCPSQMVSYWKLDETTGSTFADSSDNNVALPGSCSDCPVPTAGRVSGGQQFTNDTISVPANSAFDWSATDSFSIELWMKRSGAVSTSEVLVGRAQSGGNLQWQVGINDNGNAFARLVAVDGSGVSADVTGGPDLTDGQWHHIVFIRDAAASQNKLFVDSSNVDNSATINYTDGFDSAVAPVEIGSLNGAGFFNGSIDEVALHKLVLSDAQIVQHYKDGTVGLRVGYCSSADDIRIMPLGDSITFGSQSTGTNGYRKQLFNDLEDFSNDGLQDYYVDFVGSLSAGDGTFDMAHEGHSGRTADYITDRVEGYLATNPADVVLLHIGTNDLDSLYDGSSTDVNGIVSQTTTDVDNLLTNIWNQQPNVTVVLARIILRDISNPSDPNEYTHLLNDSIEALANGRINSGDKLVVVDQESALTYPGDMADEEHPNNAGYSNMADVWYAALNEVLPPTNEMTPQIISTAVTVANVGGAYSYDVEAAGSPAPTYSLTVNPSGMTIDGNTGLISWMPTSVETVDVTVQANNPVGSDVQSFQIAVTVNTPPVAIEDSYSTDETSPLNVLAPGVLNNDSDAEGNSLTAQLVSGVANGTLTLNSDGSFTYEHDGSTVLSDSFTYRAIDALGASNVATVSLSITNPINDKPVITSQSNLTIPMETPFEITLGHLTVMDPDNSYPADFTLAVASGANYSSTANTITATAGFSGDLTVPVTVNDGLVDSDQFNLSITVSTGSPAPSGGGGGGGGCFISTAGF